MGAAFHAHQPFKTDSETTFPCFESPRNQTSQPQPMNPLKYRSTDTLAQPPITDAKLKNPLAPSSNTSSESTNAISFNLAPGSNNPGHNTPAYWPGAAPFGYNTDNLSPYHPIPPFQSSSAPSSVTASQPPHQHQQFEHLQEPRQPPQQQSQQSQPQQSQPMAHPLMSAPPDPGRISPGISQQQTSLDPYGQRIRYAGMHQPPMSHHHPTFQPYQNAPIAMHPSTASRAPPRIAGDPAQVSVESQQSHPQFSRPYPSYSLPAMSGPVMSNVHHPGNQMALIGSMQPNLLPGFNSGHAASLHQIYNGQPNPYSHHMHGLIPPGPPNDRPFKCDKCPQSFNRNHDLKRHKRIHMTVKPFVCDHCDKRFSRKDALKRHILVKGCGKGQQSENDNKTASSASLSAPNVAGDDDASSGTRGTPSSGPGSRKGSNVGI